MAFRISLRGEVNGIKFLKGKWSKATDEKLQTLLHEAAKEWLRAVLTTIPIWRGFARGAVKFAKGPNGDLAGYLRVAIPISVTQNSPKRYYHSDGRKVPKVPERAGVFSQYSFSNTQHRYRFTFKTDVVYFALNDFYERWQHPTTPWNFHLTAQARFVNYLEANIKKSIPKISEFTVQAPLKDLGRYTDEEFE